MCGIVGYVGTQLVAKQSILRGLHQLEYRGYDSAGVALHRDGHISVIKRAGKVNQVEEALASIEEATLGIGHTRWATHGKPTETNAHPHQSEHGHFVIVHNGVIENAQALKTNYLKDVQFESTTDSEVIAQLIEHFYQQGAEALDAFQQAVRLLEGSYAIVCMYKGDAQTLYVAKNKSPLLIAKSETSFMLASDIAAFTPQCTMVMEFQDGEMAIVHPSSFVLLREDGTPVKREMDPLHFEQTDTSKGNFSHFMLKEMHEQPDVLKNLVRTYTEASGALTVDAGVIDLMKQADWINIIGCGTSYHAGLVGKRLFERIGNVPTHVFMASEFSYFTPILPKNSIAIVLSQSGETADIRNVVAQMKAKGVPVLALTNNERSTIAREADMHMHLLAGPEIAVASTKAYIAEIGVLAILAKAVGLELNHSYPFDVPKQFAIASEAMRFVLNERLDMAKCKKPLAGHQDAIVMGRAMDYYTSLEAALKIKEVSYMNCNAYPAGELKHGPIALIEEGTPVLALITNKRVAAAMRSNIEEVRARGAHVSIIAMAGLDQPGDDYVLPLVHPLLTPLVGIIPFQYISYFEALDRGLDVDQPRNLAKSVTVE
ncbi:MAG TPA: glutamine--fructose-6-phosphate transaminase (isomerizing) [Savagea sp.]